MLATVFLAQLVIIHVIHISVSPPLRPSIVRYHALVSFVASSCAAALSRWPVHRSCCARALSCPCRRPTRVGVPVHCPPRGEELPVQLRPCAVLRCGEEPPGGCALALSFRCGEGHIGAGPFLLCGEERTGASPAHFMFISLLVSTSFLSAICLILFPSLPPFLHSFPQPLMRRGPGFGVSSWDPTWAAPCLGCRDPKAPHARSPTAALRARPALCPTAAVSASRSLACNMARQRFRLRRWVLPPITLAYTSYGSRGFARAEPIAR
ncbi:hypothetical protein EXIGLDRAFT_149500 [Exidia glandulosa HHB12029]|uniref:Uncharacterized protein n=1 Tax=Exidia glandulosa HHB12029 TaxID=1314781 RepID=A0A166A7D8_EXIGL|nr:hypothetical protein EXIGLDRAFT_149500 [Exidia glandulosa HHB12029]